MCNERLLGLCLDAVLSLFLYVQYVCSSIFRIWQREGGYGKRAEHEPITGVCGAPNGVQGQSPWSGVRGGEAKPP